MNCKNQRGAITIYLSIIFLAMIILTGVIVDGARIRVAETHVQTAAYSAMTSVLSDYDYYLKNYYGIYAAELHELDNMLSYYIERSLMPNVDFGDYFDFFNYTIEGLNVSIDESYSLFNKDLLQLYILEHMKYRAPIQIGEDFLLKLELLKKVGNTSKMLKQKIEVEEALEEVGEYQLLLHIIINGFADDNGENLQYGDEFEDLIKNIHGGSDLVEYKALLQKYFVNNFINEAPFKRGKLEAYFQEIRSLKDNLKEEVKLEGLIGVTNTDVQDISQSIHQRKERISFIEATIIAGNKENNNKILQLELEELQNKFIDETAQWDEKSTEIEGYKSSLSSIHEKIKINKDNIEDIYKNLQWLIDNYKKTNNQVESTLKALQKKLEDAKKQNDELNKLFKKDMDIIEDIRKEIEKESVKVQKLLAITIPDISASVRTNVDVLEGLGGYLKNQLSYTVVNMGSTAELEGILEGKDDFIYKIMEYINGYDSNVVFKGNLPAYEKEEEIKKSDNRKIVAKEAKDTLKIQQDNEGIRIPDEVFSKLPSNNLLKEDLDNIEIDFYSKEERTNYLKAALDLMINLPQKIEAIAYDMRNGIYINEYIMGTFNNSVKGEGVTTDPNLRLEYSKYNRDMFFDYEVEYVLYGRQCQNLNMTLTKAEIIMYRFGLNLLYLYSSEEKIAIATNVAIAVAGWWTMGAGIPILKTLILCGWSMGEALIDLDDLLKGRKVPLLKNAKEWKLSLENFKIRKDYKEEETSDILRLSYHDYLRVFLLFRGNDGKLGRIQDLIQLNVNREIKQLYGVIKMDITVSIRYFFLTQPFMPKAYKFNNSRHKLSYTLINGY